MKTLFAFFAISLFATAATAATISGAVTQLGSAAPLPSMTVAAYDAAGVPRATAATDAQGRYTLTVSEGTYRVLAYDAAGVYATSFHDNAESFDTSRQFVLQAAQSVTSVDFALARGGFVAGVVTAGSSPRSAITVAAYNLSGTLRGFTKTGANGAYHLVLPAGTYKLAAYDEARIYATAFHRDSASFSRATPVGVSVEATATIDFLLSIGARIRGRATDAATGAPLGGIVVTGYDPAGDVVATSSSAADGAYELFVPAGSYRIVFEDRTGTHASVYYLGAESFDTSTTVEAGSGGSLASVDAAMQRGGRIAGSVRDANVGALLASMVVAAYNPSGTVRTFTTTNANGAYTLVVPPGSYKAGAFDTNVVYAPQFHSGQPAFAYGTTIPVAAGATVVPIDFALRRGGRVSGRVTDRATAAPLTGITVAAYDLSGTRITSVRTAADGTYRLVLAGGVYKLVAYDETLHYASGSVDASMTIATSGESTSMDFTMIAGAKVSGIVLDATNGAAIAGIVVTAYDPAAAAIASFITDASGSFAFAVPPGTWRFVAADPLHRFATSFFQNAPSFNDAQPVTLSAGDIVPSIAFRLTAATVPPRRRAARH